MYKTLLIIFLLQLKKHNFRIRCITVNSTNKILRRRTVTYIFTNKNNNLFTNLCLIRTTTTTKTFVTFHTLPSNTWYNCSFSFSLALLICVISVFYFFILHICCILYFAMESVMKWYHKIKYKIKIIRFPSR